MTLAQLRTLLRLAETEFGASDDTLVCVRVAPDDCFEPFTVKALNIGRTTALEIHAVPIDGAPLRSKPRALDVQVGGSHYKSMAIQPMQYSLANNLNAAQHTAIKYVTRYREKGGREDLEKAIHTIQLLIEHEYGDG